MKYVKHLYFLFFALSALNADPIPTYKMVDLGLLNTDSSRAYAVNDAGQVLGTFRQFDEYIFLWSEANGIEVIEKPQNNSYISKFILNNKGQFAIQCNIKSKYYIYIWDKYFGFWLIDSSDRQIQLIDLNDNGQVLLQKNEQIVIFDNGAKTNLTEIFFKHFQGKWNYFSPVKINNSGTVAFCVRDSKNHNHSFLWKKNQFTLIYPDERWHSLTVKCIDDNDNMLVEYDIPYSNYSYIVGFCFIKSDGKRFEVIEPSWDWKYIINNAPISLGCLPSVLKNNAGNSYYIKGIEIKKLIKYEDSYFNGSVSCSIEYQNSRGWVVGTIDTLTPGGYHAFLATPVLLEYDQKINH